MGTSAVFDRGRSKFAKVIFPDVVLENIGNSNEHIPYFRKYYISKKSHGAVGIVRK